jgi:hypothetical protein
MDTEVLVDDEPLLKPSSSADVAAESQRAPLLDDDKPLLTSHIQADLAAASSLLNDLSAVARGSITDGMFLATLLGFVLMLLYTLADAHKAWEAEHQLSMNVCMAILCWAFLPLVIPFIRSPCGARAAGSQLQVIGYTIGLLADYSLLIGTIAFAGLGVLLFLASRAPAYMVALLLVECVGCWGFLLSACAYAASWVLGSLPEPQAEGAETATPKAPGAGEAAGALARALAITQLEWWAHFFNIGGSLVYVLASTSSVLLVLASGQGVPMDDAQTDLRQEMAQSFVIGDILWTCDAVVFLGIWAREALKAQSAKKAGDKAGTG